MDIKTFRTPLTEERQKEYEDFLNSSGLRNEGDSDIIAWTKDDDGRLIAVGSLAGNTLKQFAVAPEAEGSGIMAQMMTRLIEEAYGNNVRIFEKQIPMSVRVAECSALGMSIYKNDPKGKAALGYESLTMEIMANSMNGGEQ